MRRYSQASHVQKPHLRVQKPPMEGYGELNTYMMGTCAPIFPLHADYRACFLGDVRWFSTVKIRLNFD